MSDYINKDLNYKIPLEEDYAQWLKLVEYESAVSYNNSTIRGSKNRIEAYGDVRKFFNEGILPEKVAEILHEHFRLEREEKERKEAEQRRKMNERTSKWLDRMEERAKRPKKKEPEVSLELQLGFYVGDYIVLKYLPTLSTDMMHSPNLVEVSEEDTIRYNELHDIWSKKRDTLPQEECKEEWETYRGFANQLQDKYLPPILECYISKVKSIKNMDEFIRGIAVSLWDCDMCCYDTKTIKIDDEDSEFFTKITISLH